MEDVKQKILVVDDDAVISELIQEALRKGGFDVAFAVNGQEALDFINKDIPDAIILDRRMPVMDGNETLKRLRADERTKAVPVVMLTGDDEVEQVIESLGLGANEYIVKPIVPEDLVSRVQATLKTGGVKRKKEKHFEGYEGKSSGW